MKRMYWALLLPLVFSLVSCAHAISKDLREQADRGLDVSQVVGNSPEKTKGKEVIWGGDIVRTTNQADGSTLIEVLQRPLDSREEPKASSTASEGRFLVRSARFLDPLIYAPGRQITVAGDIEGQQTMAVGQANIRYPVVVEKQIYLWPVASAEYYGYPAYYAYPYWDPWYPDVFFFGSFGPHHGFARHAGVPRHAGVHGGSHGGGGHGHR